MVLIRTCPFCGKDSKITVKPEEYHKYLWDEMLAQDAFPSLSATEREIIISGICFECQQMVFGGLPDEELDELSYTPAIGETDPELFD